MPTIHWSVFVELVMSKHAPSQRWSSFFPAKRRVTGKATGPRQAGATTPAASTSTSGTVVRAINDGEALDEEEDDPPAAELDQLIALADQMPSAEPQNDPEEAGDGDDDHDHDDIVDDGEGPGTGAAGSAAEPSAATSRGGRSRGRGGARARGRGRAAGAHEGIAQSYMQDTHLVLCMMSGEALGTLKLYGAKDCISAQCGRCRQRINRSHNAATRGDPEDSPQGRPIGALAMWLHLACAGDPRSHYNRYTDMELSLPLRQSARKHVEEQPVFEALFIAERAPHSHEVDARSDEPEFIDKPVFSAVGGDDDG